MEEHHYRPCIVARWKDRPPGLLMQQALSDDWWWVPCLPLEVLYRDADIPAAALATVRAQVPGPAPLEVRYLPDRADV